MPKCYCLALANFTLSESGDKFLLPNDHRLVLAELDRRNGMMVERENREREGKVKKEAGGEKWKDMHTSLAEQRGFDKTSLQCAMCFFRDTGITNCNCNLK